MLLRRSAGACRVPAPSVCFKSGRIPAFAGFPAQIPVAWAIAKGTLPIIGVTKPSHVEDAIKASNISLTADETSELEKLAESLGINAIRFWEKEMK